MAVAVVVGLGEQGSNRVAGGDLISRIEARVRVWGLSRARRGLRNNKKRPCWSAGLGVWRVTPFLESLRAAAADPGRTVRILAGPLNPSITVQENAHWIRTRLGGGLPKKKKG